ncbi:MAG: type II toxin-antitoxin system Phd/YefM family antitoxin [Pseudomonadota bacterium]|uniref:type II toxin-antitoxin system Phd/YefM family antitoxin n=1 Tax=Polaromonas sp. TaxID=1869339 RepID=UPI00183507F1|nr:type II toxin-antitoxin system Phd/YefM family antitoxin [Polaromonas sp.]MBA3593458.1 type II toxin-antitoxin system prevent-host-death family antitoxin [Polaromonas sp.]MDQ3272674.1 type II toxin-antitoxin system Phd/YefM family antitoxin [Pseudomonadota bacterium]
MLREATAMNVRQNLGELLNGVQYRHDNVVITKAGKPVAALVDMATFERMRRKNDGEFERLWAQVAKGFEDLSEEEVEKLASQALEEARDEIAQRASAASPSAPTNSSSTKT